MQAHDPMWDLQGLVDHPIPPDPVFTSALRLRLPSEFQAANQTPSHEQMEAECEEAPGVRRKRLSALIQLALIALIVFGANRAIDSNHWRNGPTPVDPAVQVRPVAGIPMPSSQPHNLVIWQQSAKEGSGLKTDSMVVVYDRIFRFVSSDAFEGIVISSTSKGDEKGRIALHAGSGSRLAASDDTVFATGTQHTDPAGNPIWSLFAFDRVGAPRWSIDLAAKPVSPLLMEGAVIVADASGVVTSVDADAGVVRWRQELPAGTTPYVLAFSATRLFVTTTSGAIVLIDTGSFTLSTITPPAGYVYRSPVAIDQTLFAIAVRVDEATSDLPASMLSAFDLSQANTRRWNRGFNGELGDLVGWGSNLFTTIPVSSAGYGTTNQRALVRIDLTNGKPLWKYAFYSARFGEIITTTSPEPMLVVPATGGVLYGLNPDTGAHSWAMGSLPVAHLVASENGRIYVVLADGMLAVIRPAPGSGVGTPRPVTPGPH